MYRLEVNSIIGGWVAVDEYKNKTEAIEEMKNRENPENFRVIKLIAWYDYELKEVE